MNNEILVVFQCENLFLYQTTWFKAHFSSTAGTKRPWERDIGMILPDFLASPLELWWARQCLLQSIQMRTGTWALGRWCTSWDYRMTLRSTMLKILIKLHRWDTYYVLVRRTYYYKLKDSSYILIRPKFFENTSQFEVENKFFQIFAAFTE